MTNNCGDQIKFNRGEWNFNESVANSFDAHVSKSIPGYFECHDIINILCDHFLVKDDKLLDIGCSTGTLLKKLSLRHNNPNLKFLGIDSSIQMIKLAKEKCAEENRITFKNSSFSDIEFETKFDVITLVYTTQFVRPKERQDFVNSVFDLLTWGGALFMFEKTRGADARFNEIINNAYLEWKIENGFSEEEVMAKLRSLRGKMEPFSVKGNIDMLNRAGFKDIETVWKWGPFEGFLAIK